MSKGYYSIMRVTDYGPYITKLVLPMDQHVRSTKVKARQFSVYCERLDKNGNVLEVPKSWMALNDLEPSRGYVPVLDAYASDIHGNEQKEGEFVTLCLKYGPTMQLAAAICAKKGVNVYIHNRFSITQVGDIDAGKGKLSGGVWDFCLGREQPDFDGWQLGASDDEKLPLRYGFFTPETRQEKKPLIIWLHGAGEGGFDPWIPFTANKVVALAKPAVQQYFGGAYIFAPQCDTFWMNDGSGEYGRSGRSMYEDALFSAIECFVARHTDIDKDRIYIGGDSNGGFMTVRMILNHPTYFAAAFPVCEALYDERITDEEIKAVKHLPVWFVHAKNDPVVKPEETVVPTYKRLKAVKAPVHFTFWDHIADIHEGFKDLKGNPYEYIGHFAWIPVFNDDCRLDYDGKPVKVGKKEVGLLEWLGMQHR